MACNCGRNKMQVTSANIVSDTAGQPTEGARTLAQRRAMARVVAAREAAQSATTSNDTDE